MSELVERVLARIRRHSPRRVVVLVRGGHELRWIQSLLAQRGPIVGARLLDLEGLLDAAARELAGEPLSPLATLAEVREALAADPQQRFAAIQDQPSYQRDVLRCFVELERASASDPDAEAMLLDRSEQGRAQTHDRDAAMLEAFARFRRALAIRDRDGDRPIWWRGQAPARVLAGHERVHFLRGDRCASKLALGFFPGTTAAWESKLLATLGFERWDGALTEQLLAAGAARDRQPLTMRLSCAGPEAEIAAAARILRGERRWLMRLGSNQRPASATAAAAVAAPAEDIPRWVARLGHRDIPVRAWVDQRAGDTAAARTVRALLRVATSTAAGEAVARSDLEAVLFGPALKAWAAIAEDLDVDFPSSPNPGDLRGVWDEQRASSFSLTTISARLRAAGERGSEALLERAQRFAWTDELLAGRQQRLADAHRLLAAAIERITTIDGPGSLRALLDDWDLLGRAAIHGIDGPEMTAARVIIDGLGEPQQSLPELVATLDHALSFAT
ncbi:MAG: hypothetical protein KC431_16445, partial [Myxococcales bacterium]|nr:hypothetical protein [Myxococcales bacterium]